MSPSAPLLCFALGWLCASPGLFAAELSPRLRAAIVAGYDDYHGHPFPAVVEPPLAAAADATSGPPSGDPEIVQMAPVKVNTARLPLSRLFATPTTRNVVERWLPGTGVTITQTPGGGVKTVGKLFFIPVYWNLKW